MLNARCYDWLIDGQPAQRGFAELGDVPCSVQVSVKAEPTLPARKEAAVSVASFSVSADTTFLACVPGVNEDNTLSKGFRFIAEELLELPVTPTAEEFVESPTVGLFPFDLQLLQNEGVCVRFNKPLTQTVVHIPHKPFLSPAETLQVSLSGTSAFALQACLQPLDASFDVPELSAVEELIRTGDDGIDYATVNPQHLLRLLDLRGFVFGVHVQEQAAVLHTQRGCRDSPISVSLKIVWHLDWNLYPTTQGRQGNDSLFEHRREGSGIVPDSAAHLLHRQNLPLLLFLLVLSPKHITGLVTSGTDETRLQVRILLPHRLIGHVVDFQFVERLRLERLLENKVAGFVVGLHRVTEPFIRLQPQLNRPIHRYSYGTWVYIPVGSSYIMDKRDKAFMQGFCCCAAFVARDHHMPTVAKDALTCNGFSLKYLRASEIDDYDLKELEKLWCEE